MSYIIVPYLLCRPVIIPRDLSLAISFLRVIFVAKYFSIVCATYTRILTKGLTLKALQVAWSPIHTLTSRIDLMAFSITIIHNFLIRPAQLEIDRGAGVRQWGWTEGWILLHGLG